MSDDVRLRTIRAKIAELPGSPGVYLMKGPAGQVLYVGKAKSLRSRVGSYFQEAADLLNSRGPEIARMSALVVDVECVERETEVDALLTEARLIKDIQPAFNERLKDDKTFPYLEITTRDEFPAVFVTRRPRHKGSKLYGPFTNVQGVRAAVNALQKVFKFRTCELEIAESDESRRFFRPCLLHAINQCTAPCAALISPEDYARDIERLKRFLGSKKSAFLRDLKKEMETAAAERRFEEAATLRDRIRAIEALAESGTPDEHVQPEVFFVDPTAGLEKLGELLNLDGPPRTIEAIDIATLLGGESVGSLVCFIDGRPFKNGYKRFRIRTVEGIDDYAMVREVVTRRYRYAAEGEELYPDVILIDGGLGHLHAAQEAFSEMNLRPPMVISLAKREEEVYVQARTKPLRLPRNNEALRLLQQVRDEAHRFAQAYHHLLRRKKVLGQDDAPARRPRRSGAAPSGPPEDPPPSPPTP